MVQVTRITLAPRCLAPLLILCLSLAGCGSPEPLRRDRFYSLEPVPLEGPAGAPLAAVLQVNNLAARGFVGGKQIVYRTGAEPLLVQRYDDLLWEQAPSRALSQSLVEAIRAARVFRTVTIPADRVRPDFVLGGELARFEHLPTDQPPRVVGALSLVLVRASDGAPVASRQYSAAEIANASTPDAMAEAFNRLAGRLAADAVRDLQSVKPRLGAGAAL
jgi:cholesterol transport system auxiliary component